MKTHPEEVAAFQIALQPLLSQLTDALANVRSAVEAEAMGKSVKGDQITALLGEVLAAKLVGGSIQVSDKEPDIVVAGKRYEVKTRVHSKSASWRESSPISSVDHATRPDYLLFQELGEDYGLRRAWCFPWAWLVSEGHIRKKVSRGNQIGHYFYLSKELEEAEGYQIYPGTPTSA